MNNRITTSSYGFFIFSLSNFMDFLKNEKIKKKNLLDLFDKNKDLLQQLCLIEHIAIPLIKITNTTYKIFVNENSLEQLDNNWKEIFNYQDFALNVGEDGIWIASFEFFEDWNPKVFETNKSSITQEIATGPNRELICYNKAIHFAESSGLKNVSIKGFRNSTANPKRLSNEIGYEINFTDAVNISFNNPLVKDFNLEF
ncbi:hypothetical protein [Epilithonimonas xixisoli]|uniref:Uncharacterized protein n=1 Tax=Epilithonimonas xixisoli TaxID=1476462 RepID=A0A4R8IJU8_9FLAO|nr:hypothetical protein [Epilithonimonas xixisoli]TDX87293.1 hypothetical protein B0I22_1481 [Epilithonimonas xixisoli]